LEGKKKKKKKTELTYNDMYSANSAFVLHKRLY